MQRYTASSHFSDGVGLHFVLRLTADLMRYAGYGPPEISLVFCISRTAAQYSFHQLFSIISDCREKTAHAALLFPEVSSSKREYA